MPVLSSPYMPMARVMAAAVPRYVPPVHRSSTSSSEETATASCSSSVSDFVTRDHLPLNQVTHVATSVKDRYSVVAEDKRYSTVDLQLDEPIKYVSFQEHERFWLRHIAISPASMASLGEAGSALVSLIIDWCTRIDPAQRPSMQMVAEVLHAGLHGRLCTLAQRLCTAQLHGRYTTGDLACVAALGRCSSERLDIDGSTMNGRVSETGLLALAALLECPRVCCMQLSSS